MEGRNKLHDSQVIDVDGDEHSSGPEFDDEEAFSDPGQEIPDEQDPHEAYEQERAHAAGKRRKTARRALDFPPGGGDLAEFFGDIDFGQQISICRAYASYLAAQSRARKPGYPSTYIRRSK